MTNNYWMHRITCGENASPYAQHLFFGNGNDSGDEHVVFKFSNRDKNPDLLKKTLVRIGMKDKIGGMKDCIADICTSFTDANDVAAKLSETLKKIQG